MTASPPSYIGRFAPSPTGPLHAGSIVAALASWLDARAQQGRWLLRIEDIDGPRNRAGAQDSILRTLEALGLEWDGEILLQSTRMDAYQDALDYLIRSDHVFACACTRKDLQAYGMVYPGTCRSGLPAGLSPRAWRLKIPSTRIEFEDRWHGARSEDTAKLYGDPVLKRADGFWAYQIAVVVDDAWQGVSDVVRGADLLESTGRQIHLQHALALPTPRFLHVPVVLNANKEKLSKQTLAPAVDANSPVPTLHAAAQHLGLPVPDSAEFANPQDFLREALAHWRRRFY